MNRIPCCKTLQILIDDRSQTNKILRLLKSRGCYELNPTEHNINETQLILRSFYCVLRLPYLDNTNLIWLDHHLPKLCCNKDFTLLGHCKNTYYLRIVYTVDTPSEKVRINSIYNQQFRLVQLFKMYAPQNSTLPIRKSPSEF